MLLGRCRGTGGCRSYTVAWRATVGHLGKGVGYKNAANHDAQKPRDDRFETTPLKILQIPVFLGSLETHENHEMLFLKMTPDRSETILAL